MWLAEDTGGHDDPGSPPLEGGEALCELMVEPNSSSLEKSEVNLLTNLASFLEDNSPDRLHDVFPAIQEALPAAQPEVQLAASSSFLTILERELVPHATFTQTFLQSILTSVDSRDPVVANAWIETLLDVIDLLPKEVVKQEILSLAVAKGQLSQPVTSRLSCCRMLGKICAKFEPYLIKKEILPVVQSLCQDVDYVVRGCMCRQLDAVARGLGLEHTKSAILPELVELANDEESYVRLAGIETVVNMLSLLDDETCTQTIVPLVKKLCENCIKSQDVTLPVVAKQLGKLCHGLSVNLTTEQKSWFLDFYRQIAKLGLPQHADDRHPDSVQQPMPDIVPQFDDYDKYAECRYCCAYNFPAMVLFAGPKKFGSQLYDTFHDLACDPHVKVRRTIACGLHEVARLLGPCVHFIELELVYLLRDDSLEVLKGLIPHLPVTLEALAKEGTMGNELKWCDGNDVMAALVHCEDVISRTSNWRLSAELLEKLSCLPKCLSSNTIFHKFTPLLFRKLFTARPIPCRVAAASTLLVFLRSNPRQDQRHELCRRLIEELCQGHSCYSRMLFITVCDLIMDTFPKSFFKEYFFMPLLELAGDPIANVRLRLCSTIPRLKTLLRFPTDSNLLQELETSVGKLMMDEDDRDVSAAVRQAILELDKIEVQIDTAVSRHSAQLDELVDHQMEEDEEAQQHFLVVTDDKPASPVPIVVKSPERKSLKSVGGKIPILRNSSELKRSSSNIGSSLIALHLNTSPTHEKSSVNGGFSRIPTLQNRTQPTFERARTPIKSSSQQQLAGKWSPTRVLPEPRSSVGSPLPSPESIRRVVQARLTSTSPIACRRKSLGATTTVGLISDAAPPSPRIPRPTSATSFKDTSSSSLHHHQSHIPRYSSPWLAEDDHLPPRLHFLSLASSSSSFHTNISSPLATPDDYELELLHLVDQEEACEPPRPDITLVVGDKSVGSSPLCLAAARSAPRGGGGKMFEHWSKSHIPRCMTPPVVEGRPDKGRNSKSASSSPTYSCQSFIPRYVGSPTRSTTTGMLSLMRTNSSAQLTHNTRRGSGNVAPLWSRASSLPGTPRMASPTRCLSLPQSRIPCPTATTTTTSSSSTRRNVCSSRSVRSLVRELESLSVAPKFQGAASSSKPNS